jgi:Lamin Tail Domain
MFRTTRLAFGLCAALSAAACTAAPAAAPTTAPAAAPKPTVAPAVSPAASVAASPALVASPAVVASPSPAAALVAPSPSPAALASPSPALAIASPSPLVSLSPAAVSASPSAAAAGSVTSLTLVSVQPGAPDSTITLQNSGSSPVDLSGWSLVIGTVSIRLPANTRVDAGQRLVLHTGTGTSTGQDVYLGQDFNTLATAIQPGAIVGLRDASGAMVTQTTIP